MTDPLRDSFEIAGKVLAHLVKDGLLKEKLNANDVINGYVDEDSDEAYRMRDLFCSVVEWLISEGLIAGERSGYYDFQGLQLTSKGIVALQSPQFDSANSKSATSVIAADEKGLSGDTYAKIGNFVGGFVGSFTKTVT